MVRLIKEEEPPSPSLRLSGSGPALATISRQRGTEPARLKKLVRGELDWIVMKCLEKDRTRRYETANALARDIERYLADEPVEACPPSAGYLLRKFLRRNKGKVVAAAAVLVTLLAGIAGTTFGMIGAIINGRAAIVAAENANSAGQVIAQDLLAAAHNFGEPDPDMQLRFALKASVWRIDANMRGNLTPSVEMAARMALGRALIGLAEYEEGRRHAERALELGRQNGETHIDTLIATLLVAVADRYLGNYEQAERAAERLLELCWEPRRETRFLTLEVVGLRAALHVDRGRPDEAQRLLNDSLEAARDRYGEEDEYTLLAYGELLRFYLVHGKAREAEPLCARALKAAEKGSNQQRHANLLFLLGTCQLRLGSAAEAERVLREATATGGWSSPDYGRDHLAKTRLGAAVAAQGRFAEAEPLLLQGYERLKRRRTTPYWEREREEALNELVRLYDAWGKNDDAAKWRSELAGLTAKPAEGNR